jgi:hypothetical protein
MTMTQKLNIQKAFKKEYFWDVDISSLDAGKSKRLIVERVFNLGTLNEIKLVVNFYGTKKVVDVLQNLNYMDPKTLNFCSKLFNIPFHLFKCYRRRQSLPLHWNS